MSLLLITSLVLILTGIIYSPKDLFDAKSQLAKKLKSLAKSNYIIGLIAIALGLILGGLFIWHLIKELKWLLLLVIATTSFSVGLVLSGEKIKDLTTNNFVHKLVQVGQDIDSTLRKSLSAKLLAIILMGLGLTGIISALIFHF